MPHLCIKPACDSMDCVMCNCAVPMTTQPQRNKGGRPPAPPHLRRINVPVRLPAWLVEWIDAQSGTRADVIESALIRSHRLRKPHRTKP